MIFRIGFLFVLISALTACGKKNEEAISIEGRWQMTSSLESGKQTLTAGQLFLIEFSGDKYRTSDSAKDNGAWTSYDSYSRSGNKLVLQSGSKREEYTIASLSQNAMKLKTNSIETELQRTGATPAGSAPSPTAGGPEIPGSQIPEPGEAMSGYWVGYEGEQAYQSEAVFTIQFNPNFSAVVSSADASFPSATYQYNLSADTTGALDFSSGYQFYRFYILSQSSSEIHLRQYSGKYYTMVKIQ